MSSMFMESHDETDPEESYQTSCSNTGFPFACHK